ncbi:MAG TPA: type II toxin-antitoxin system VapB family antitoxin [Actinoplanes sp.]|jgi:Arc/MetJ family transcription regulator
MTETMTKPDSEPEVDENLLVEAQRQLDIHSPNAAINEALRRLVEYEREKRRHARDQVRKMVEDGELDFRPLESVDE